MLVLSRGENDRIVFPSLGISIEVLKVARRKASIGIEAPRDIRIVRDELSVYEDCSPEEMTSRDLRKSESHRLRNRVNSATLKLQLAAKYLKLGKLDEGLADMMEAIAELSVIEGDSESPTSADQMTLSEAKATFDEPNRINAEHDGLAEGKSNRRILLVDDDANERTLLASYLTKCGIDVKQASDGLNALYALSHAKPMDAVLLDMNMPNLDGKSTVHQIRTCSTQRDIPVFGVTGQSIDQAGLVIGDQGVNGWFQKPVNAEEIAETIERLVPA